MTNSELYLKDRSSRILNSVLDVILRPYWLLCMSPFVCLIHLPSNLVFILHSDIVPNEASSNINSTF